MSIADPELVQQALSSGQISLLDPRTGRRRSLYANCPHDGEPTPVRRVVRGSDRSIIELVMRCLRCHREFPATPEMLYLR